MSTNLISGRIKAAGAVLWRPGAPGPAAGAAPGVELALIHRPRYDDWSFPKGKAEPGEHAVLTALREVAEETGYRCVLGRRLPSIEYQVLGRPKRVKYWAARALGTSDFEPNDEVDQLEWVTAAEARERLTSPLDRGVLEAFLAAPAESFALVLQRHGKAESRAGWHSDDLERPLAAAGREQALVLAELLAAYGADEVISSPAVRCLATIGPYAQRAEVPVRTDSALTEISYVHAPRALVSWFRELVERRRAAVVCTHGPLLDELISAVLYNPGLGGSLAFGHGPTLAGRPWNAQTADRWADESLPTGCAWVLHFDAASSDDGPRLLAVDRLTL